MRRLSGWDHAAILITALHLAAAAHIWMNGIEGYIPMHFDLQGNVDRWGTRHEAAMVVLVCGLATLVTHLAITFGTRKAALEKGSRTAIAMGRLAGMFIPLSVSALIGGVALGLYWGEPEGIVRLILGSSWLSIGLIGALCGKVRPNRWVGVRTSWTFKSRLAWEKSNRLLGRIFFFGALAGLAATPFLTTPQMAAMLFAVVMGGAAASLYEAWRTWKTDPERQP